MDISYLKRLEKLDTSNISEAINSELRIISGDNKSRYSTILAYILYRAAKDKIKNPGSIELFENICDVDDSIKRELTYYFPEILPILDRLKVYGFDVENLLSYLLFNNDLEDVLQEASTPRGILKLVAKILDIQENDSVLELCSGKGNFFVELTLLRENLKYIGIECNMAINFIANIRASLLDRDISLVLNDAMTYKAEKKVDKLFANYPFLISIPDIEDIVKDFVDLPDNIKRVSSDWIFNLKLVEQMKSGGRAVAIMKNGTTWNSTDRKIREYFVENGLIEAIVLLPAKLLPGTSIATTLVIFSHGNTNIKMIDAGENFTKEGRRNILSDNDISDILELLQKDGKNSITISINEIAENDYIINASRYLEKAPEIKDGVEIASIVKSITRGAQVKASYLDENRASEPTPYKYIMISNISDGDVFFTDNQYLKDIQSNVKKFCIRNNSIVLTKTGSTDFKSAVIQVKEGTEILATGNMFILEIDETKANPYYVQALFDSELGRALFKSIYVGSVIPTISLEKLRKLEIPLPSPEEQNIIGEKYKEELERMADLKEKLSISREKLKRIYNIKNNME
ncbi:N-6 DNA methylase [Lachnoanaerobaculum sp. Marseille-Q4761]|uniref:N-6 DNA methylase n=1 Tax=Lachnoanaerobaculum sp. Marseille-Q4761 TaxID=2819511 RepID=UPI001AA10F7B|nr:N-6 DNA methylase [Lachnoanaerobaculum sp. Marseille-Q4761]MBO1872044.1 N-6 DNA methylase [Lachnoanaerobaculum sp. Marseille-Q4761]